MKKSTQTLWMASLATALLAAPVRAQNAPGEDPVILTKRITTQMLPINSGRTSTPLESVNSMPAWMKAKVARYEAKANADQTDGMSTDADAVRSASSDGFRKTCIQEVGSATASGALSGSGQNVLGNNQQIVVLKGDLVNICR